MTETSLLKIDQINVQLIRSRRRSLAVEVNADGVKVRAPMRMPELEIRQFLEQKQAWIEGHLANIVPRAAPVALHDGMTLTLQGEPRILHLHAGRRGKALLREGCVELPVLKTQLESEAALRRKLHQFYRQHALIHLRERVRHWMPLIAALRNKRPAPVNVRSYRRRWGSCAEDGRISFNWRLIQAPQHVIDYVVVHELIHLVEFNHSTRFWKLVAEHIPARQQAQSWLQRHGGELYSI